MSGSARRTADGADAVHAALDSFFDKVRQGSFPRLVNRETRMVLTRDSPRPRLQRPCHPSGRSLVLDSFCFRGVEADQDDGDGDQNEIVAIPNIQSARR